MAHVTLALTLRHMADAVPEPKTLEVATEADARYASARTWTPGPPNSTTNTTTCTLTARPPPPPETTRS